MEELIGKVKLDYRDYPGEDLYSDGEEEDRLLELAKTCTPLELNEIGAKEKTWAVMYHFSYIRENIVSWLPIRKSDKVLEIGSGCGAVTGALAGLAGSVTCVELSKKRSLINAYRHKELDNIDIRLGNFKDVEKHLDNDYNVITLIGVFEYAKRYMDSKEPFSDFLKIIKKHLAPKGVVVIAIENRLGLKYFAGAREDHCGIYFEGIEGYPNYDGAETFSRPEIEEFLKAAEFEAYSFYYPYPDYKFPMSIYSDLYLPGVGELRNNINNFDRQRMVLFDEGRFYDSITNSELFKQFSNSFLIVAGEAGDDLIY